MRIVLPMLLVLILTVPVLAQEGTAEPAAGAAAIMVNDQVSLNGLLVVSSVTIDVPGWVAIHAVGQDGQPAHVVGISPVLPGTTENLTVLYDVGMSTPTLVAELHVDDTTLGMFEYDKVEGADLPITDGTAPIMSQFTVTAILAFDQQISNAVVAAVVIAPNAGTLSVYADNGGALDTGNLLGQVPLNQGTAAPVIVPLTAAPSAAGTVHFALEDASGARFTVNNVEAVDSILLSDTPVLLTAVGLPIVQDAAVTDPTPAIVPAEMSENMSGELPTSLTLNQVLSPVAGFIDVHSDFGGHPGHSLGHTAVVAGETTLLNVPFTEAAMIEGEPMSDMVQITPVVFPMLHVDDMTSGVYEYLMVPGADAPIVYNGAIVTLPVTIGMVMEGTVEPGMTGTMEAGTGGEATPAATATP